MNHERIECHPLQPFLPNHARLLILGSFPPLQERWCMPFFYPNPQNDMWRIMGQIFFGDKQHFVDGKVFKYEEIVSFCQEQGLAIYDTAKAVRRLHGNAADEHLEIVEKTFRVVTEDGEPKWIRPVQQGAEHEEIAEETARNIRILDVIELETTDFCGADCQSENVYFNRMRISNSSQLAGFAKGSDLIYFLKQIANIDYRHITDFAPTKELLSDYRAGKVNWQEYERVFADLMTKRRINQRYKVADFDNCCFLCSEETPEHCHRRLLAEYLKQQDPDNVWIMHLVS